eukprot:GEMP01016075.1.p1 GENE.GEMP01016075.1~~GEMP01016075.1.p1  ORF type:complete len:775 (+),score=189.88 GEMP01016075.1:334-2658(+)
MRMLSFATCFFFATHVEVATADQYYPLLQRQDKKNLSLKIRCQDMKTEKITEREEHDFQALMKKEVLDKFDSIGNVNSFCDEALCKKGHKLVGTIVRHHCVQEFTRSKCLAEAKANKASAGKTMPCFLAEMSHMSSSPEAYRDLIQDNEKVKLASAQRFRKEHPDLCIQDPTTNRLECDAGLAAERRFAASWSLRMKAVAKKKCEDLETRQTNTNPWGPPNSIPTWFAPRVPCGKATAVTVLARRLRVVYMQHWFTEMEKELDTGENQWFAQTLPGYHKMSHSIRPVDAHFRALHMPLAEPTPVNPNVQDDFTPSADYLPSADPYAGPREFANSLKEQSREAEEASPSENENSEGEENEETEGETDNKGELRPSEDAVGGEEAGAGHGKHHLEEAAKGHKDEAVKAKEEEPKEEPAKANEEEHEEEPVKAKGKKPKEELAKAKGKARKEEAVKTKVENYLDLLRVRSEEERENPDIFAPSDSVQPITAFLYDVVADEMSSAQPPLNSPSSEVHQAEHDFAHLPLLKMWKLYGVDSHVRLPTIIGYSQWKNFLNSPRLWNVDFWKLISPANVKRMIAESKKTKEFCAKLDMSTADYRVTAGHQGEIEFGVCSLALIISRLEAVRRAKTMAIKMSLDEQRENGAFFGLGSERLDREARAGGKIGESASGVASGYVRPLSQHMVQISPFGRTRKDGHTPSEKFIHDIRPYLAPDRTDASSLGKKHDLYEYKSAAQMLPGAVIEPRRGSQVVGDIHKEQPYLLAPMFTGQFADSTPQG